MTTAYEIPPDTRDISNEVLDSDGRLKILPAAYWQGVTAAERGLFGMRNAVYSFPTVELVVYLRALIGDRSAIEIGAGSGVLAEALGIPATDSYQQHMLQYWAAYRRAGQPVVRYGPAVERLDAAAAVRKYRPDVVIASWVTHLYQADRHWAEGNEVGVDEEDVLAHCAEYVVIGNERVHQYKKIWDREHRIEHPSWLFSRALNNSPNFIARWRGLAGS